MKALSAIKYVLLCVGLAMLAAAVLSWQSASQFLAQATAVSGRVTGFETSYNEGVVNYKAVVEFFGESGERHRLVSSFASNPPAYEEGESVEVLHLPGQPEDARIRGYFELWGVATVMGAIGAIFFSTGAILWLVARIKGLKRYDLQRNGRVVAAQFMLVQSNHRISLNGQHPFVIVCQWLDPQTRKMHVFESENIWFNPTRLIGDKTIDVHIEPNNPKNYYVDISFLPQVAA